MSFSLGGLTILYKVYLEILRHRKILFNELLNLTSLPREVLDESLKNLGELIEFRDETIYLKKPLDLALLLLRKGFSAKEISRYLDWKDFEKVSAEILSRHRYMVKTNFMATKPVRLEIDVIGVDIGSGRSLFIDCKHWSRGVSRSALREIIDKHVERIGKFTKYYSWFRDKWYYFRYIEYIVPLIITLTTPSLRCYRNTLVVSIQEFNQFLLDIYSVLDTFDIEPYRVKQV